MTSALFQSYIRANQMRADTVGHVTKPLTSLPAIACRDTQVLCARSILMNAKATRAVMQITRTRVWIK
ncbi:hypothetical protein LSAT2_030768 [Lamellibrachia satsuma]|nr:hypothetical protein LSAT2_030768 [Lamellibrachia satsuma]